ncbi:PilW family protein [Colwellia sp. TT2012]|uniref:PilW family protein n=1 Tax=Colwellia sp. TT2012 TaxID=1720342 RepID=UPI0009E72FF2|nr:PilW family protein [Colwellia sp. TT2012]
MKKNLKNSNRANLVLLKVKTRQQGFTLVELMISLSIGLVVIAGVLSVFVGMQRTVKETSSYGELQENGRFAISLLTDDLLRQNFWGDYTGSLNFSSLDAVPVIAALDNCVGGGVNNGTYPLAVGTFRTLWGETSTAVGATNMTCITDAAPDSDVIQLKRVIAFPSDPADPLAVPLANNFSYFVANSDHGALYKLPLVPAAVVPIINNSQVWQYQHHIYYVRAGIPVLMKWRLTTQMVNEPMVDGIERIYFMYGVSNVIDPTVAGYGVINAYVSAANMTAALWNNTNSRILAVKIYVLARSILPDNNYENENTYILGDQTPYIPADNFRRLLLSSTVTLFNSGDTWL